MPRIKRGGGVGVKPSGKEAWRAFSPVPSTGCRDRPLHFIPAAQLLEPTHRTIARENLPVRANPPPRDPANSAPSSAAEAEPRLKEHLKRAREKHLQDPPCGAGKDSLGRKPPDACREWAWQSLFPAASLCPHPRTRNLARYHLRDDSKARQFREAVRKSGIPKRATTHAMRHSFATHLVESGTDIRTAQDLLGHADVDITMIDLHVMKRPGAGVPSPLDPG